MTAIPRFENEKLEDAPEEIRDAVRQLSFAYKRSEELLKREAEGGADVIADALRRAEAILFAAGEPLSAEQVAEVLPQGIDAATVLMSLKAAYAHRGVTLVEVAGKWRFQTAEDLAYLFVEERQEQKKLSQAALETLAIISYGQPVTRAEIEVVLGNQPAAQPVLGQTQGESLSASVGRHLQHYFDLHGNMLPPPGLYARILREVELPLIEIALDATGGNQAKCADLLGINRNTLRKKIKDLEISVTRRRKLM